MRKAKVVAALIGGGAVVVLGVLTAGIHQTVPDGTPRAKPTMSTGETFTISKAPTSLLIPRASPQITGPAKLPPEEEAAK